MTRNRLLALVSFVVVVAALSSCRGKDEPGRAQNGSAGVNTMAEGSFYSGPQDWEKAAEKAYDVKQPTPQTGAAAAPAPAPAPATK